jgi:hypothetical protein
VIEQSSRFGKRMFQIAGLLRKEIKSHKLKKCSEKSCQAKFFSRLSVNISALRLGDCSIDVDRIAVSLITAMRA